MTAPGFKQVSDFNATPSVQDSDLIYSYDVTRSVEQASTVKQLRQYVESDIASNLTDPGAFTGTESIPVGRTTLFASTLTKIAAWIVSTYQGFVASGTGTVARTLQVKLNDIVSVKDFGAKGDGVTDDTAAITAAVASGYALFWPAGTYLLSSTIKPAVGQNWTATDTVIIKNIAAAGTPVAPVFDFVSRIHISGDFIVDHAANVGNYTNPTVYGGNIIAGSAILVQADYSTVENIKVKNAWDNGISVVQLSTSTGLAVAGSPKYWRVSGVRTTGCGVGIHTGTTPGKIGAGIDVASGSSGVVSDCVDFNSYLGFIEDIGAGAQCAWSNCISWYALLDTANPTNGSGYGFYNGSGDSSFTNCLSVGSAYRGWWLDAPAQNCEYTNCYAYIPQHEGFWIKSPQVTLTNCRVKGAGQAAANIYDAFLIDSSAGAITELVLVGCGTTQSTHRYGVNAIGSNSIKAQIIGNSLTGGTAPVNLGTYSIGLFLWDQPSGNKFGVNRVAPGFPFDVYGRGRFSAEQANTSSLVNVFGDSGNNGTLFIEDNATPTKRAALGYDPVNDWFVAQAIQAGTAKKPFVINPAGGGVALGLGAPSVGTTDGLVQIPKMPGAPTGTPTVITGYAPMVFDSTNSKIWVWNGSAWKGTVLS